MSPKSTFGKQVLPAVALDIYEHPLAKFDASNQDPPPQVQPAVRKHHPALPPDQYWAVDYDKVYHSNTEWSLEEIRAAAHGWTPPTPPSSQTSTTATASAITITYDAPDGKGKWIVQPSSITVGEQEYSLEELRAKAKHGYHPTTSLPRDHWIVDFYAVYSNGGEYSLEELRAMHRDKHPPKPSSPPKRRQEDDDIVDIRPKSNKKLRKKASPTIHTKAAMNDVMELFNQPSEAEQFHLMTPLHPTAAKKVADGLATPAMKPFVFTDENVENVPPRRPLGSKMPLSEKPKRAFAIFTDEQPAAPFSADSKPRKPRLPMVDVTPKQLPSFHEEEEDEDDEVVFKDGTMHVKASADEEFVDDNLTLAIAKLQGDFDVFEQPDMSWEPQEEEEEALATPAPLRPYERKALTPIAEVTEMSMFPKSMSDTSVWSRRASVAVADYTIEGLSAVLGSPFKPMEDGSMDQSFDASCLEDRSILLNEDGTVYPFAVYEKQRIVASAQPRIDDHPDFYNCTEDAARQRAAIDKAARLGNAYGFSIGERNFAVGRKLGEGGQGHVYLVAEMLDTMEEEEQQRAYGEHVAVKIESPGSLWEFHMLKQVFARLPQGDVRHRMSIVRPLGFWLYSDESFMLLPFSTQGSILDYVNTCKASKSPGQALSSQQHPVVPEMLVAYFVCELAATLQALHSAGFIHGDIKPENVLIRLDSTSAGKSTPYDARDPQVWQHYGIKLIDFGRAIDLSQYDDARQLFKMDIEPDPEDCAAVRRGEGFRLDIDWNGCASVLYCMLHGRRLETFEPEDGEQGSRRRPRLSPKRYWKKDMWERVFDVLLNTEGLSDVEVKSQVDTMIDELQAYLVQEGGKKGKQLKSRLMETEIAMLMAADRV
jgi:hypothetical protein